MGQEFSAPIDPNTPPQTLSARTVQGVADFIKDGMPKRIVVMTGAGTSTSAGIPDFRSPGTGLYANLGRLNLPSPEAVFDISYFRQNPNPFYVLAKELYPGKYYPTVSHAFAALLDKKDMLSMLFTQNIDCLERRAGIPSSKIVEAHGSFATQRCIECHTEFPEDLMKEMVESSTVPHCLVPHCDGLVKPDIVFFGEALPDSFHNNSHLAASADIIIVMGTSLTVAPFGSLPQFAQGGVPRVLINKDIVGSFGSRPDDVMILGDCDAGVRKLADALGWREELEALWATIRGPVKEKGPEAITTDEALEESIKKLAEQVDATLKISQDHTKNVQNELAKAPKNATSSSISPASPASKDPLSSSASTVPSDLPTKSELGWKEPPTTPETALAENVPLNIEQLMEGPTKNELLKEEEELTEKPFALDMTFPQNRPNADPNPSHRF